MLIKEDSKRVTYAAVFIPDDASQPTEFVLPADTRHVPHEFVRYDFNRHARAAMKGHLVCGNCFEGAEGNEPKEVDVHHRRGSRNAHATFSTYPDTIGDHTQYCQSRRDKLQAAFDAREVRFNILGSREAWKDPRLDGYKVFNVRGQLSDLVKAADHMSRERVQAAQYVIEGRVVPHANFFIDGDNWKRMVQKINGKGIAEYLPRIFHVSRLQTESLRDFASSAAGLPEQEIKIGLRQYEFFDEQNVRHIIQPSIMTDKDSVKSLFEMDGDYLVFGSFTHLPFKTRGSTVIHDIRIRLDDEGQAVRLYKKEGRQIRDYNALHSLGIDAVEVTVIEPQHRAAARPRKAQVMPGQADLFEPADAPKLH